jgi:hypothetical protein
MTTPFKNHPVTSSTIKSLSYDGEDLIIKFNNDSEYSYEKVPETLVDGLLNSSSVGKYFHAHIKNKFLTTKLT